MRRLSKLKEKYFSYDLINISLKDTSEKYKNFKFKTLYDLAAVATGLSIEIVRDGKVDPLALKAIRDTNPNFDPTSYYTDEQLLGIINSSKGKYFEYLVVDKLNAGEQVGEVILPNGFTAILADSFNQPGWDVAILDQNGIFADYLQLKATNSIGVIQTAINKYPDIQIVTTEEVMNSVSDSSLILNSDITEKELLAEINQGIGIGEGFLDVFWDTFNPIIPLIAISSHLGYSIVMKKTTIVSALGDAKYRAGRAIFTLGVGSTAKSFGAGFFSVPIALVFGFFISRQIDYSKMTTITKELRLRLSALHMFQRRLAKI